MPSPLVDHLLAPPPDGPAALFGESVTFASPFAEYEGRDLVGELFTRIPAVLTTPEIHRELTGERERATVLSARVGHHDAQAILDERYGDDGLIVEVTLFLRPYPAVREAGRLMGVLTD